MPEKTLNQRLLLIGGVLALAIWLIYPPSQKLRAGLDIAGGVSLIYEIDDTGAENDPNLAENMKRLLMKRVDPNGVYDLAWRVLGRNRLEIQMPLPPAQVTELRRKYAGAMDALFSSNISRNELENAVSQTGAEREKAIQELTGGTPERVALANKAAQAYDAYVAAQEAYRKGPESAPAGSQPSTSSAPASAPATLEQLQMRLSDAEEALEDSYDAYLATNLDQKRFLDVLEMDERSTIRENSLTDLTKQHPELESKIKAVVAAYKEWHKNRGYLDGPADLQRLLRGSGVLEFRILADLSRENPTRYNRYREQLAVRGTQPAPGDELGWFRVDNPVKFFDLKSQSDLAKFDPKSSQFVADKRGDEFYVLAKLGQEDGLLHGQRWQLRNAGLNRDAHGGWCVDFELDPQGGELFQELTRRNIGHPLCILVDGVAYSAPNIKSKIYTRGQITGDFSREKASYLVQTMQAGSLPARLKDTPISERTIGSSLGATNRDMAFRSGIIGVIVVGLFMAGYYMVGGMVADAAMLLNIVLVLAVMAMLQARFTLPGIAGVILTVGMSVDANVLIFERMREEKERGSSLRQIIKNGYDRAFPVILDSNLTTILTCVILYYVGSEEVKGFGLTLGWGVAMSLFTALFVTRTIFTLLIKYGWLREIRMLKLIGVPKIDWWRLRKVFIPISLVVTIAGTALFLARGKQDYLDVEFQGGVSAEVEVKPAAAGEKPLDDVQMRSLLAQEGRTISAEADKLDQAEVTPVAGNPGTFQVAAAGLDAEALAALLTEPMEDAKLLRRGGVTALGEEAAMTVRANDGVTTEQLQTFIRGQAPSLHKSGENIAGATIGSVIETSFGAQKGRFWNITTIEQNRRLVQYALEGALGKRLQRQQRVRFEYRSGPNNEPFPIQGRAPRLENVIKDPSFPVGMSAESVADYSGGAAMYFDKLQPPQSVDPSVVGSISDRLRNMRLQPGFQDMPFRKSKVIGIQPAGTDEQGHPLYASVVVVVVDDKYRYSDDPDQWNAQFAQKELNLATTALNSEQSLRKVSQFKPQIAQRASEQAVLAVILSWLMIILYMWVRFGRVMYGVGGVVALVHDVLVGVAALGVAGWLATLVPGLSRMLLIEDFKINMTTVAAVLTIIGYSINDTIVVFDRIRERRGRLGRVTPQVINDSINQTLSRTILTAGTVWMVVIVMYIFGGSSIRGFNFCMLAGTITGCYSSIAIASPLLLAHVRRGQALEA